MSAELSATVPIDCDGCGQPAAPEHLRRRIATLEWASRFRPVRIGTLFLTPAPAAELEDYFYFPEGQARDPEARALQEDLFESCGIARTDAPARKDSLQKFQEAGYFLTACVECPIDISAPGEFDALLSLMAPTLLRRIRLSYRPKSILLISERLNTLVEALGSAGDEHGPLVLGGGAVALPKASDRAARAQFRTKVAALLREAAHRSG